MHLDLVSLPVTDPALHAAFYADALGLPVTVAGGAAHVQVGPCLLVFRGPAPGGPHHLAFTIPTGTFAAAKTWLAERAELLDRSGEDEFEGPARWNSRSVYFSGPEDSVLELIVRRDLEPPAARPPAAAFGPADLLVLSEVGLAVADVPDTARRLEREAGIGSYGDPPGATFAAVGDVDGLLVLVGEGRPWLPTTDRLSAAATTLVQASGARPGRYGLGGDSELLVTG